MTNILFSSSSFGHSSGNFGYNTNTKNPEEIKFKDICTDLDGEHQQLVNGKIK